MKIDNNELLLIYDSNDLQERAMLAYAKSTTDQVIKEIDVRSHVFTESQFEQIAEKLHLTLADLVDRESPTFIKEYINVKLTDEDILIALKKNGDLIKTPLALYKNEGRIINSSYELIKEGMLK